METGAQRFDKDLWAAWFEALRMEALIWVWDHVNTAMISEETEAAAWSVCGWYSLWQLYIFGILMNGHF